MPNFLIPYTTPANYTYDSDKIEVSGGLAQLKEILTNVYARWHLNESSGANAPDSSGNGRDGTLINMEDGDWVAGKLNNCLQFDGVNEYVNCGDIVGFERDEPFTIEAWIKTSSATVQRIVSRRFNSGSFRGWDLSVDATGKISVVLMNTPTNRIWTQTSATGFNDNAWHHIVFTYDGSSSASGVHIYVDNVDEPQTVNADNLSATVVATLNCQIGARDGDKTPFVGTIDEVVIYDKELSQAEVSFKYNSGAGRENWYYYDDSPTIYKTAGDTDIISIFQSFIETLGGGNQGAVGYQLSVDGINWDYWNGSIWTSAGSNYNTAAVVNTNIPSYNAIPDKIYVKAFLISDGEQAVKLDENQIGYSVNIDPIVYAGTDKSVVVTQSIAPFSNCTFSDPDGTVDHAYYKIDSEVNIWTEILQGGYATLLEAVQAFTYQYNFLGTFKTRLKVEDNLGAEAEDVLDIFVLTVDYPDENDVRDGVDFDTGLKTGTLVVPVETDVRKGVKYDSNGNRYGDLVVATLEAEVDDGTITAKVADNNISVTVECS